MPFAPLIGHRHLFELLARAVARETLPPSLCFAGPPGVGKFAAATALAQALNCEAPVRAPGPDAAAAGKPREHTARAADAAGIPPELEADACGVCRSCRRLARAAEQARAGVDTALDCFRVALPDERGSLKVGAVRDLIAASAFRPFDGRRRVIVIDEADALEISAQNALLKVLEEPPSGTAFVLVTARPDALLGTVRSRCSRLRFGPLASSEVEGFLRERNVPADAATAIAAQSGGSLEQALKLAAGDALEARRVAAEVLRQVAGGGSVRRRLEAAQLLIARGEGRAGNRKVTSATTRAQIAGRLDAMAALLRDVQVVSTRADPRWLAHADLAPDLAGLARAFDGRRASGAFSAVDRAQFALDRNVSHKAVADWLAFEL